MPEDSKFKKKLISWVFKGKTYTYNLNDKHKYIWHILNQKSGKREEVIRLGDIVDYMISVTPKAENDISFKEFLSACNQEQLKVAEAIMEGKQIAKIGMNWDKFLRIKRELGFLVEQYLII